MYFLAFCLNPLSPCACHLQRIKTTQKQLQKIITTQKQLQKIITTQKDRNNTTTTQKEYNNSKRSNIRNLNVLKQH